MTRSLQHFFLACSLGLLASCGSGLSGSGNMGGPTVAERNAAIAAEAPGDYYIGRRYFVQKTRFWGYLRKPRQPWSKAQMVIMLENRKHQPDRLPEDGPQGRQFGFDQNYEYKIFGHFNGQQSYDPNSNQALPEFVLTGYEVLNRNPGWLFRPDDRYDPYRITVVNR